MAARRLIAILLVLLFLSSLAAALAPVQERTPQESSTSTTPEPADPTDVGGTRDARVIDQTIDASGKSPVRVKARAGDRLELKVTSTRSGTLELVGLGPAEDVGPRQPAFFDVLLANEGTYPVQFIDTQQDVARIEVAPPRTVPASR